MRPVALLLALALPFQAAPALAHGDDAEDPYDPLVFDLLLFATTERTLAEDAPEAGEAHFAASEPNKSPPPLDFELAIPAPARLEGSASVALTLVADKPMMMRDKDGSTVEISLLRNGEPVPGASARAGPDPAGSLALQSGSLAVRVPLKVDGLEWAEGDKLALRLQPLVPVVPDKGLKLLVGGETGATLHFPTVRLPTAADLKLQDAPLETRTLASKPDFRSGASVVHFDLRVGHDRAELGPLEPPQGRRAFLLLHGVEPTADAHAHHEAFDPAKRAALAHQYQVGDRLVRVHPGLVVKVPLQPGPDGLNVAVKCVRNCPQGGFSATIPLLAPDDPEGATGGTLIPPPRSTKGIPVSEDAPAEEARNRLLPLPGAPLVLAALALAAGPAARRGRSKP